jgi:hypothetical protein
MGLNFGGSSSKTSSSEYGTYNGATTPWTEQQPYLTQGFDAAKSTYGSSPSNLQTYGNTGTAAYLPSGYTLPFTTTDTATTLQSAAPSYVANATNIASGNTSPQGTLSNIAANGIAGPNAGLMGSLYGIGTGAYTTANGNPTLSAALDRAAITGADQLNGFSRTLQRVGDMSLSDPTQRVVNDAATYASNPSVQASIDATNRMIDQTTNEQTIPQLNRTAAAGGALNSSRAGAAEAQALEAAAIAKGNADAQITNNAWNTGIGTAANLWNSGLSNATSSAMFGYNDVANNANNIANRNVGLSEFNTNAALNASNAGLSQGLNYGTADTQARLNAANADLSGLISGNSQLGNATAAGVTSADEAINQAGGLYSLADTAGTNSLWQNLDNYWNIVANNNWGNNSSGNYTKIGNSSTSGSSMGFKFNLFGG